ncbi:MAG: hypothetical protein II650_04930 [Clostridia bacterium]|nr:hypothetical protein [Clostridia bacterium]MBQ4193583.1 hypothetical protein [Clostridia bacterium]
MAELMEYKCPACGGALEFDPKIQKMKCPYCDSEYEMAELQAKDEQLNQGAAAVTGAAVTGPDGEPVDPESAAPLPEDDLNWNTNAGSEWGYGETDGMRVYVCNSCGGEIVGDANMAATSCPFCGNPVVMMGNFTGALKPDLVIPFKLDKKAAKDALRMHAKSKKLVPKFFCEEQHLDEIKGIYVPYWLFDSSADVQMRFRATRSRAWSDSRYDYVETEDYLVDRAGSLDFEAVPADGSSKMDDTLMESIEPFDISEAVPFQTAYLAGYLADKYDVTAEQSVERANDRIKKTAEETFRGQVQGYETVTLDSSSIRLRDSRVRYALYPVWLLNTSWKGEKYTFAMNAQTGKFIGDLPMDKGAWWKYLLLYGGIITAVAYLLVTLFQKLL